MNKQHLFMSRKYHLKKDFTPKDVLALVQNHKANRLGYKTLQDYYLGKHDILYRKFNDPSKPNNHAVNNFARLIVDTSTAYFLGEPVTYLCKDKKFLEKFTEVQRDNFSIDVDAELGKLSSIYGHAYELHYMQDGVHKFKAVSPYNMFMCYSSGIEEIPLCAVLYEEHKDAISKEDIIFVQVFTKDSILEYQAENGEIKIPPIVRPHYFGEVPAIEYIANEERQGDFETVITLIDAYNTAVSDSINDVEYWNDAYLLLKNLDATTQEDISAMKENRVLLVDGEGDARFISKNVQDTHIENIKDRLTMDIHKFSQTPNLNDEQFATNLSGVAIKYKMLGLENKTAIKERKFTSALIKRVSLIRNILNLRGNNFAFEYVEPVFTRNLPANLVELGDLVSKIRGLVSDETLRSQLPFVLDNEEEEKRLEKEKESQMDFSIVSPPNNTGEPEGLNINGEDEEE